jgi:eukaryotic-like serine/threonine-protein kinase
MKCEACSTENVEGARFCASCGALMPTATSTAPGDDPMVGQLIGGRYRVTGILGEGGMGIVYVGEQQMGTTVRKVAIKTLHQHLSKDTAVKARFHRECGTVAQLEHPNTIKFYDFGSTQDGTLYIAMEFVSGRPLSEVIQDGPLPADRVIKIMRQVCGALDEAHMQGVIHRDLKPENVVLTQRAGESDFVKVLDFGIAARTESADAQKEQKLTQQGMVLGTPPYMSPEQFTGKALDARSDIYSLGVMSYELLTGKLPFEADTPWQWATQHMTAQPIPFEVSAPAKNFPDHMRKAILRSLSKDKEQRPTTARDFFTELSDGGRMTVEQPKDAARSGTAAMEQAPNLMAPAPVHPGPAYAAPIPHHPVGTGPAVAVPAAPPMTRGKQGGGKGLVIGLGAMGGLLLVAIAIVAVKAMKPEDDPPIADNPIPTSTGTLGGPGTATVEPLGTAPPDVPPTPSTNEPASTATGGTTKPAQGGGTGTKPPPTPAGDPCDACINAAKGGNISGAAAALNKCTDAAKKQLCSAHAKRGAQGAVKAQAFNGNCAGAQSIISAAAAFGADAQARKGLEGSKCAK